MRYKLSSPLQMTNGGSDAQLDAVDLENMLRGISDHSAVPGELRDSYPNHFGPNRISKNSKSNQISNRKQSNQIFWGLNRITMCFKSRFKSNRDLILPTTDYITGHWTDRKP